VNVVDMVDINVEQAAHIRNILNTSKLLTLNTTVCCTSAAISLFHTTHTAAQMQMRPQRQRQRHLASPEAEAAVDVDVPWFHLTATFSVLGLKVLQRSDCRTSLGQIREGMLEEQRAQNVDAGASAHVSDVGQYLGHVTAMFKTAGGLGIAHRVGYLYDI
jgi:hypothetical protein